MEKKVRKLGKKLLAALLSVALIAGAVNLVPMEASAEGANITPAATGAEDLSYTGAQLAFEWGSGVETALTDTNQWNIEFTSTENYPQAKFKLPQDIDMSKVDAVTFAISSQTSIIDFQFVNGQDNVWVDYYKTGQNLYTYDFTGENAKDFVATHIVIMLDGANTETGNCVFDGVYFDVHAENAGGGDQGDQATPNITPAAIGAEDLSYTGAQITFEWGSGVETALTSTNQWSIEFTSTENYPQAKFKLPQDIDMSKVDAVTFAISSQTSIIDFQFVNGQDNVWVDYYKTGQNLYTYDFTGENAKDFVATHIVIMLDGANTETGNCVFDGVYFDVHAENAGGDAATNITPAKTGSEDVVFVASELTKAWGEATETALEANRVSLLLPAQYNQIVYTLKDYATVDLTKCKTVTFYVSEQSGPIALKLFDAEYQEISSFTKYSQNGQTAYTYDVTGMTQTVTQIGIMLNEDLADQTCVLDGVYFDMMSEAELNPGEGGGVLVEGNLTPAKSGAEDVAYVATDLAKAWGEAAEAPTDASQIGLTFAAQYNQVVYTLKDYATVDLTKCKTVTFYISEQSCPIALKLFDSEYQEISSFTKYGQSGKTAYTFDVSAMTQTVTQIGVMLSDDLTDQTCVLDGVYFDMKNDEELGGGSDEPTVDETANLTPAASSAEDKSWKASDLTGVSASSGSVTELGGPNSDEWKIAFNGQWGEWKITLPESIDLSMLDTFSFYVSEQSVPLSFKFYAGDTEVNAVYGQTGKTKYDYNFPGLTDVITHVGIMVSDDASGMKCSLDGIYVDMLTKKLETYTETFNAADLTVSSSDATSAQLVNGKWVIQFSALNQQVKFALPEKINFAKCKAMTFTVSAGQVGPVNFYAYSEGADAGTFYYNVDKTEYVLSPSKSLKADTVGVQCGGETFTEGSTITIESISFMMEGKKPLPLPEDTDGDGLVSVAPTFFVNVEASASVTVEEKVVGGQTVSEIAFTNANDYVDFEIPDTVDIAHLANIVLDLEVVSGTGSQSLAGQAVDGLTISLLDKDKNILSTGNSDTLQVNGNENARYIRVQSNEADQDVQLATVTFELDMTIVGDIVKNGYFEDTNMDMWPNHVTRVDNGAPFIAGETFTTYGEIGTRDSNYTCFEQNIFSRVEPGKYYEITFWAKLSDDYAGAEPNMRVIAFNPYHANAGGTVYGQVPFGTVSEKILEVGQWTQMKVTMQVPYDATSFTIRIMEQGEPSQYGSGPGIKGSYAVAGISIQETTPFVSVNSTGGGGGKWFDQRPVTFSQGYTMDEVVMDWASAVVEETEEGHLKLNFNNQYDEARFKLPRSYDASEIVNFKVDISGTNVPLALKLYSKGSMVGVEWINTIWENGQTLHISPNLTGSIDGFGLMALKVPTEDSFATMTGVIIDFVKEPAPVPRRATIAANGDFSNDDLSDWQASYWGQEEGVSMFREVSAKPFGDGSTYFASYNKRTSPYQCFAQDITGYVEQNEIYTFSFWAKLSDDYIGAPDTQRVVQFSPYTVDKDGVSDYNPQLEGTYIKVLEPGVWTKFEGKYKVTNANEIASVVIRILEQGTDYGQGECVLGGYSIADFKMDVYVPEPPSIDEDVPNLDDVMTGVFGEDFIVGSAFASGTLDDIGTEMILKKHFNAVTIGNELKPDALFGYSNAQHTKLQTITFNGQELVVPTLDYSRAEMILDKIVKWNKQNPDHQFKVRGHVLVWHAQTPEWFFRENYVVGQNADGSENYVTPEVMNLRLEWFIKTVLEHFTGEDSEYKDLFYGWDVVNEAVSDGSGSYRTDKVANGEKPSDPTHGSNSSWWAVYGSNEFIIKAFQYANKYAPADLELYYNDYNECNSSKVKGIVKLLQDVLAAEGTRIDAMGMQAHHNLMNPSNRMIEDAIRAYAAVVGNVQITELDLKASRALSNEKNIQDEYADQAKRYYEIYEILKKLDAEDGINITGITFWGVSDKDSWLQSSSNVGGGSDGSMSQCPLLFDGNYKVKPAFWAFVDYTVVDPEYKFEPTPIPKDETPKGDIDPEAEQPKEEVKEEVQNNEVSSDEVVAPQPKKASAVPFVAAGVAVVVIGAGAAVWFLKKKK